MENDKNKQTASEAAEALPDDALGEVTGGSSDAVDGGFHDTFAPFAGPDEGFSAGPMTRSVGSPEPLYTFYCGEKGCWTAHTILKLKDKFQVCPICGGPIYIR